MRTIQVYSEGDEEMSRTLRDSFRLIANAVYNAYTGQRHAESLAPEILFLQGVPFEPNELQQSFRFVGVRPPDISPPSVKRTTFLDEDFEPYNLLLEGKITPEKAQKGREERWARTIKATLNNSGTALIRVGAEHVSLPKSAIMKIFSGIRRSATGNLPKILQQEGIGITIIHCIPDVNEVYGKK